MPENPLSTPIDMLRLTHAKTGEIFVDKPLPDPLPDPRTGLKEVNHENELRKRTLQRYLEAGFSFAGGSFESAIVKAGSLQPRNEPISSPKVTLTLEELQQMIAVESAKAAAAAVAEANTKTKAPAEKPSPKPEAKAPAAETK